MTAYYCINPQIKCKIYIHTCYGSGHAGKNMFGTVESNTIHRGLTLKIQDKYCVLTPKGVGG